MLKLLLALLLVLPAQRLITPEPARFHEGQVWEYRTRPGDEGSLLKIQRMDSSPDGLGPTYHISVIGVRLGGRGHTQIQHLPVSEQSLSSSVTQLSQSNAVFPSADEGYTLWHRAHGGVFDIPLAQIIAIVAQQISGPADPVPAT